MRDLAKQFRADCHAKLLSFSPAINSVSESPVSYCQELKEIKRETLAEVSFSLNVCLLFLNKLLNKLSE